MDGEWNLKRIRYLLIRSLFELFRLACGSNHHSVYLYRSSKLTSFRKNSDEETWSDLPMATEQKSRWREAEITNQNYT